MSIATLVEKVFVETNQPELVAETQNAVRRAIGWYHGLARFSKDEQTELLHVAPASKSFTILRSDILLREIYYFKSSKDGLPIPEVDLSECRSSGNRMWNSGDSIEIRLASPVNTIFAVGAAPFKMQEASWLAKKYDWCMVDKACEFLYSGPINDPTRAANYQARCGGSRIGLLNPGTWTHQILSNEAHT